MINPKEVGLAILFWLVVIYVGLFLIKSIGNIEGDKSLDAFYKKLETATTSECYFFPDSKDKSEDNYRVVQYFFEQREKEKRVVK